MVFVFSICFHLTLGFSHITWTVTRSCQIASAALNLIFPTLLIYSFRNKTGFHNLGNTMVKSIPWLLLFSHSGRTARLWALCLTWKNHSQLNPLSSHLGILDIMGWGGAECGDGQTEDRCGKEAWSVHVCLLDPRGKHGIPCLNTQLHGGQRGLTRELPFSNKCGENQSLQKHTRGSFLAHQRRGCQCRARGHGKNRTRKVLLGVDRAWDVRYGSFTL